MSYLCRSTYLTMLTCLAAVLLTFNLPQLFARPAVSRKLDKLTQPTPINMVELVKRLENLAPTITELMGIGGTAGLSLGVLHKGEVIHTANFGYRDVEAKLPVTEETIFSGCSLTKAVTAASLAMLVEDGKVTWDEPIKTYFPAFKTKDGTLNEQLTLADILSHRSGMSWADNLIVGTDNNELIPGADSMKYLNSQTRLLPFRAQMAYNNLGYELAGHVISHLTGAVWSDFVRSRILEPLGMKRTFFTTPASNIENVAKSYNTLDDATPVLITATKIGDDGFGGASGGIRTCVRDLLKLYRTFLVSADQFETGLNSTADSPLKQLSQLWSAKIPMNQPTRTETSYAMGWARVQLPGQMGGVGCNPPLMPHGMPIVGTGVPSRLVIYHQGSLPGALAAVNLIPDTQTAIVVLSNSLTLNDTPDWIGQLIMEEVLEVPQKTDFILAAKDSVAENAKWYPTTLHDLQKDQKQGTSPRPLQDYVGTYWNDIHVVKIEVLEENNSLYWKLQGLESEKWRLDHYQNDVFTWFRTRDELAARGRWVDQGADFWKVEFEMSEDDEIGSLKWVHDMGVPAVTYTKVKKASL